MGSDISRKTFKSHKHYSGVVMQQGRVQIDADWNEQLDIALHRTHTEAIDVIGHSGVPQGVNNGNSFAITVHGSGNDLNIDWGRIYVEGLLCELEKPSTYHTQPYHPSGAVAPGSSPGSPLSPPNSPPSPSINEIKDGTYIAYLEAWQRAVNYLDDPHIQEVALGGADTATRLQNVWQVKLLEVTPDGNTNNCETAFQEWTDLIQPLSGKLHVQTKQASAGDNPCDLPPTAGFQRVENQLYRVEVHQGGTLAQTQFKWSRDNATVETIIESVSGGVLTVASLGKDDVLKFDIGQWVEVVDDLSDLNQHPQRLYQINDIRPENKEIILNVNNLERQGVGTMKLRRWDQSVGATQNGVAADASSWIDLEDGIQVQFSAGTYQAGDYWLIPARTITGNIEWPLNAAGTFIPQFPHGVKHVFTRLGLIAVESGNIRILDDCRKVFKPLTDLDCDCEGVCELVAEPGKEGWETIFSKIPDGADAQICFQIGNYPLRGPVRIANKGHLKLIGAGKGTRIIADGHEKGLIFANCDSVLARDLYLETTEVGMRSGNNTKNLNGAINCLDCAEVQIDTVDVKCGAGLRRAATCITVHDAKVARIQNCDLSVGNAQQGILLVNVAESFVSKNTIHTYDLPAGLSFADTMVNRKERASARKAVMAEMRISKKAEPLGDRNVSAKVDDLYVSFRTKGRLKEEYKTMIRDAPAENRASVAKMKRYLEAEVDKMHLDAQYREKYPAFEAYFADVDTNSEAVASQGITIGGTVAAKVKIVENNIKDVLQGIHVGVSHSAPRNVHDQSGAVLIANNTIDVKLPPNTHKLGRHGVFVGNCDDLIIENNSIYISRMPEADYIYIDGIRVWGIFGPRVMITKNFVGSKSGNVKDSFDTGIRLKPVIPIRQGAQWIVMWNMTPSKTRNVSVSDGAVDVAGTNYPL